MFNVVSSPTRRYVAICINHKGEHYARSFYLPSKPEESFNDSNHAAWYFVRWLEPTALIVGCMTFENYNNITHIEKE